MFQMDIQVDQSTNEHNKNSTTKVTTLFVINKKETHTDKQIHNTKPNEKMVNNVPKKNKQQKQKKKLASRRKQNK